jgi:hypothetical protein
VYIKDGLGFKRASEMKRALPKRPNAATLALASRAVLCSWVKLKTGVRTVARAVTQQRNQSPSSPVVSKYLVLIKR